MFGGWCECVGDLNLCVPLCMSWHVCVCLCVGRFDFVSLCVMMFCKIAGSGGDRTLDIRVISTTL